MNKCLHLIYSGLFSYVERGKLHSKEAFNEMGSFSSKMRSIRYGANLREAESNEETNSEIDDEPRSATDISQMVENSAKRERTDETNGGEANTAAATNQEQQVAPKVGQSFSWLASTPVVLNTTTKEQKAKGKRPMEGKGAGPVMKYSNEKYLKSGQPHSGESSSSSTKGNARSSSAHDYKEERSTKHGHMSDASSSRCPSVPVGFGAVGKQTGTRLGTSLKQTLSLEIKEDGTTL